jgi:hypothetical protein
MRYVPDESVREYLPDPPVLLLTTPVEEYVVGHCPQANDIPRLLVPSQAKAVLSVIMFSWLTVNDLLAWFTTVVMPLVKSDPTDNPVFIIPIAYKG